MGEWKALELFEREAAVLRQLEHPGVPRVFESFEVEDELGLRFCVVQELLPGRSLAAWIADGWHVREEQVVDIAEQALDILSYLHTRDPPVVHRDIKPENILLGDNGKVSLVDFGSVGLLHAQAGGAGTVAGTFGYMAPEQASGNAGPAADLYSLGATLLFLAGQRAPTAYPRRGLHLALRGHVKLSPATLAWLERMLEPTPADRFAGASEALTALRRRHERLRRQRIRRAGSLVAVLVGAAFAGGVLATAALDWQAARHRPDAREADAPPQIEGPAPPGPCVERNCSARLEMQRFITQIRSRPSDGETLEAMVWCQGDGPSVAWGDLYLSYNRGTISGAKGWYPLPLTSRGRDGWHHIAVTRTRARMALFVDGKPVLQQTCAGNVCGKPIPESATLVLRDHGEQVRDRPVATGAFVDDLRLWRVVRTQEQIASSIGQSIPVDDPDLVAAWDFDESSPLAERTGQQPDLQFEYWTSDASLRLAAAPPRGE
jgi:hypothetical protein